MPWPAASILGVDVNLSGYTCIGYAKTAGRRCRNPIGAPRRQRAVHILDQISHSDPKSRHIEPLLEELAEETLCLRWHQPQGDYLIKQWMQAIRGAVRNGSIQSETRLPASHNRAPTNAASRLAHTPIPVVNAPVVPHAGLHEAPRASTTVAAAASTTPTNPVQTPATHPQPEPQAIAPPPLPPCTSTHATRRTLPSDCLVCKEPMLISDNLRWCKAQCGHNVHASCWAEWAAHRRSQGLSLLCLICRSPWPSPCTHDAEPPSFEPGNFSVRIPEGNARLHDQLMTVWGQMPPELLRYVQWQPIGNAPPAGDGTAAGDAPSDGQATTQAAAEAEDSPMGGTADVPHPIAAEARVIDAANDPQPATLDADPPESAPAVHSGEAGGAGADLANMLQAYVSALAVLAVVARYVCAYLFVLAVRLVF